MYSFSTAMRRWKDFIKHVDEKYRQWKLDTKVKVFHESMLCFMKCPWNCILCNTPKEKCHNPCLKTFLVAFNVSHHSLRTCILERKKLSSRLLKWSGMAFNQVRRWIVLLFLVFVTEFQQILFNSSFIYKKITKTK